MISKRSFLVGLIAAPVIIRAGILMPIKVIEPIRVFTLADYEALINKMAENYQKKIADAIMYGNNFEYGGLKFFVEDNTLKSERITISKVFKK